MKAITLKLPDTLDHQLTHFAQSHKGLSKSAIVRQAIELYLSMAPQASALSGAVAAKKWVGIIANAPADLSSNPAYLGDFGR